jgi:TolB-like protein/tRNA A-37 threonylcarbamoyl transferase component Bud32
MSRVFLAEETALQRKVVIKILPPELAAEVNAERFRREIQLAAKLQHPYIVPVLSTGMAGGLPYFTMPFVEGESLRGRLQKTGEFPVPEAIAIMRDVLEALSYAHECGVVHRDIKPENVLLARNHAHVADFGVAKALSASTNAQSGLTSLGVALGTPAYMSPEQAMADPSTDHRADLYAVGAMAYEMLTGYQVFTARSPQAMLAAHATETPEPIERRRPNTPPALAALIMRLLDKHPADRPQSASEALGLLAAATTPSGGMAPTAQYATTNPAPRQKSRRGMWTAIAVGIGAAVAVGGYAASHRNGAAAPAASENPSIAVMPFENMSGDPKNDYLGDGLSEELIGGLSRVKGLQVAARTSSFAFKGKSEDVRSIGSKLGVSSVLGGSVRRAGNKLRVSVQLTNVSTGYNLWSETYDREMSDVFAVEDDISKAIVGALALRLTKTQGSGQIVEKSTDDPVAYDLYLKGRYAFAQRGVHLHEAEKYFQGAIALDSTFALAWAGLADVYGVMTTWGMISPNDAEAKSIPLAERAVALAPGLPEPHLSLGFARCTLSRETESGVAELKRAIALNPSLGLAHYFYSMCLKSQVAGIAMAEALEARRLEPLNAQFVNAEVRAYQLAHQEAEAKKLLLATIPSAPNLGSLRAQLFWIYADEGDTLNMRLAAEKLFVTNPGHADGIKGLLAIVNHDAMTLRRNQSFYRDHPDAVGIWLAGGYALLSNADSSIAWLDRTYAVNGDIIGWVQYPAFDRIRFDPRYAKLKVKYQIP